MDKILSRKGAQAALEFMTTYGWAILIILVAIGALSYFGLMSPQKVLPDKCIFGNGLTCQDSLITNRTVHMTLYNGIGKTIYTVSVTPDGFVASNCSVLPNASVSDAPIKIDCKLPAALTINDRKKFKFIVNYRKTLSGYDQASLGEVYGIVK